MIFEQGPRPEDSYTMISNRLARESNMSLQAKGIYIFMRSHRSGWSMNVRSVADALGVSKDTVSKYINELIEFGYIQREQAQGSDGQFGDVRYLILSEPSPNSPDTVNQDSICPKFPDTVLPDTVNQDTKEDYSSKKTIREEDEKNTNGDSGESPKARTRHSYIPEFEEFWLRYPRKKGDKKKAEAAWKEIVGGGEISHEDLIQATDAFAEECVDTPKQYIAYPLTFLSQRRFMDFMHRSSRPDIRQMLEEFVSKEDEVDESLPF